MARVLVVATALWLLPMAAAAQDRLLSAPAQMRLPSASLDRAPLGALVDRDLFLATPTTYEPGFHEPPRFDPRFLCCDGFVGPVFGSSAPWWAPPPQIVYVPVILREAPALAPAPPPPAAPPPAPLPPPMPGTPKTFYVIPRCYAGDRPPDPDTLPPGCDMKQLRTIPPFLK